jgi:hypothetical protein
MIKISNQLITVWSLVIITVLSNYNLYGQNNTSITSACGWTDSKLNNIFPLNSTNGIYLRIFKIDAALPNFCELIEIVNNRRSWQSTYITAKYNGFDYKLQCVDLSPKYGYDSLMSALTISDFFILENALDKYSQIILKSQGGINLPLLLPDDGICYVVEIRNRKLLTNTYSFYAPEIINRTLIDYEIVDEPLIQFVKILEILRSQLFKQF